MTPPQKVLIVDDKEENLFLLRSLLEELDVEVIEAANGQDALALTLDHRFSLAILDVMMPGMDGYELARHLKGNLAMRNLPIIFVSAVFSEESYIFKGYESGGVDYIVKPYNPAVLLAKVRVFLDLDRARGELDEMLTELAASEERFRTLVATIPDIVYQLDNEGRFTYLNDAIRTLGYDQEELVGASFAEIIHPEDLRDIRRESILPMHMNLSEEPGYELQLLDEDRAGLWLAKGLEVRLVPKGNRPEASDDTGDDEENVLIGEINSSGLYGRETPGDKSGLLLGLVGVIRDINDRKQVERELEEYNINLETIVQERTAKLQGEIVERQRAETALAERERYFRGMMHNLHEDLVVVDRQYRIADVNQTYLNNIGRKREEIIGLPCKEVFRRYRLSCGDDCSDCFFQGVFETGQPSVSLHEHQLETGGQGHVEITLSPLKDSSGEVAHVVAAIHDVTEIVRSRQVVEDAHRKLLVAIRVGKVGFWDWGFASDRITYSTEWKTQLGYEENEEPEAPFDMEERLHPEDREQTLRLLESLKRGEKDEFVIEFRLRHKDGSYRWMHCRAQVIVGESGSVQGIIGCNIDITEKKTEEERREKLQDQLIQAQKMESVGHLAGGVAHDFNNMLSVILGYGNELLEDLPLSDPLREAAEEVVNAGKRSAALTRQLLAFSRRQTLQMEVLNLNELIYDFEKMLRRLISEDIDLVFMPAEDLDNVEIDAGQLEQVIMNLVVNARDAMPQGGKLTIETKNVELDEDFVKTHFNVQPGDYVALSISDTGQGMDKEMQKKIFEPFYTTKERGKGTGLGLSTVYGIVKQLNGTIWVYSEPGIGSTFKVYFPVHSGAPKATRKQRAVDDKLGTGELILVVEDEVSLQKLCKKILESLNFNVEIASSGDEAIRLIEEKNILPDMLLTDVIMPGMSGRALADRLRDSFPDLKVLFMSGYTDNVIVHHGVLDKDTPLIPKPFDKESLRKKVKEVLRGE